MNVAQPALGLQIRQLERDLGVPLLIRHSRGISPTDAGNILYDRALEILAAVEDVRNEIISYDGKQNASLVLGLTIGTTALLGRSILTDVQTAFPTFQLSLVEEMSVVLVDAMERDEVDIAFAYDVSERPGLLRIPLLEEEVLFVKAAERSNDTGPISFPEVLEHTLVLPNSRDSIRLRVQEVADRLALDVKIGFEASSVTALKQMVLEDDVATIMPYACIKQELEMGIMTGRRITDPVVKRTLYFVKGLRQGRFLRDREVIDYLGKALSRFSEMLGPLATPLTAMEESLGQLSEKRAGSILGSEK